MHSIKVRTMMESGRDRQQPREEGTKKKCKAEEQNETHERKECEKSITGTLAEEKKHLTEQRSLVPWKASIPGQRQPGATTLPAMVILRVSAAPLTPGPP